MMKRIGVIGAGVMGVGVSHVFARAGQLVKLIDISQDVLQKAKREIYNNTRFQVFFNKGNSGAVDPDEVISRIEFTTEYEALQDAEFIIENVPEKFEIKKGVYRTIDEICSTQCIFAVNTSCISITQIGSLVKAPSRVIGAHFMNPVYAIPAVEVIRGVYTTDETVASLTELLACIGKECIVVNDYPGFVSNRISHLLMNEAAFIVENQVASPKDVDDIFKKCYGHKMGPLETADLIGIDTVVNSLDILFESYQDPKYRCCPLLRKMVHAGKLGRKTKEGFYSY